MAVHVMMKTFDVQWGEPKMPENVKKFFFDSVDNKENDIWLRYLVGEDSTDPNNILDDWLINELKLSNDDEILLKHWW